MQVGPARRQNAVLGLGSQQRHVPQRRAHTVVGMKWWTTLCFDLVVVLASRPSDARRMARRPTLLGGIVNTAWPFVVALIGTTGILIGLQRPTELVTNGALVWVGTLVFGMWIRARSGDGVQGELRDRGGRFPGPVHARLAPAGGPASARRSLTVDEFNRQPGEFNRPPASSPAIPPNLIGFPASSTIISGERRDLLPRAHPPTDTQR